MTAQPSTSTICIIIGASHAGVNCAFNLRREGWQGRIILIDADPNLPYHRPPLSKSFLTEEGGIEKIALRPLESYEQENIQLKFGKVIAIDPGAKQVKLSDGNILSYDQLVIATGARALVPPIPGLDAVDKLFVLRQATDIQKIRHALEASPSKRVLIIGGGYIGLELAASLTKFGAKVQLLEREERILARVTAPEMSTFFHQLHLSRGVEISTGKNVRAFHALDGAYQAECADGSQFEGDLVVLGVGIQVNTELATACGLKVENGISVDSTTQTSDPAIYAIGDCSYHYNAYYDRFVRLESVQNAVDQAKVAAANICGREKHYNALPWFWSDQYELKLQTAGLFNGYDEVLMRMEPHKENSFSIWYFKGDRLLAVDAVNQAKAYVVGMKLLREQRPIEKSRLVDPATPLRPAALLKSC